MTGGERAAVEALLDAALRVLLTVSPVRESQARFELLEAAIPVIDLLGAHQERRVDGRTSQ